MHPQSIVHAMVRLRDGAVLAHLGHPDMRVPISFALTHPERAATPVPPLDFSQPLTLEFESPDTRAFQCLALARAAGEAGGIAPCTLNAANEVAVAAFLAGRIGFPEIAEVVERVLGRRLPSRWWSWPRCTLPTAAPEQAREAGGRRSDIILIVGLLILVLLHELGHFSAAKRSACARCASRSASRR